MEIVLIKNRDGFRVFQGCFETDEKEEYFFFATVNDIDDSDEIHARFFKIDMEGSINNVDSSIISETIIKRIITETQIK